jgi:hypothetical protein
MIKNLLCSTKNDHLHYSRAPIFADSISVVSVVCGLPLLEKKKGKLKKYMVHKFQNVRQARTGHNMVKSSSPNMPCT